MEYSSTIVTTLTLVCLAQVESNSCFKPYCALNRDYSYLPTPCFPPPQIQAPSFSLSTPLSSTAPLYPSLPCSLIPSCPPKCPSFPQLPLPRLPFPLLPPANCPLPTLPRSTPCFPPPCLPKYYPKLKPCPLSPSCPPKCFSRPIHLPRPAPCFIQPYLLECLPSPPKHCSPLPCSLLTSFPPKYNSLPIPLVCSASSRYAPPYSTPRFPYRGSCCPTSSQCPVQYLSQNLPCPASYPPCFLPPPCTSYPSQTSISSPPYSYDFQPTKRLPMSQSQPYFSSPLKCDAKTKCNCGPDCKCGCQCGGECKCKH